MLNGFPRPRHRRQVIAVHRPRFRDRGTEAPATARPRQREVIGPVIEDRSVMAAVSEKSDKNAQGDREPDIVSVVVAVNQQGPRDEAGAEERRHDDQPLPEAGVVVGKGLQFRIEVESQKGAEEEGFRRVAAGERLHGEEQGGFGFGGLVRAVFGGDEPPVWERVGQVGSWEVGIADGDEERPELAC